ncbi:hypothetical protein PUNSTDRAFT_144314 [Punctularia strigosozonata HHB-11173 SS5]|uniref:uncharacterized protein n=1 Tax=Punctularia strigosozonata (strain HHB-11173) TaxID=741275 RepID=UPI0004416C38|nr:uncharacterized protein PUNSTDRAFT_144314 [Punctularia strigosozonata HHB-11173 SS5]EIN07776.1 hypothetical protein PUNSTDRAFT_144314 [Punctularia strigosozonata HHB-11173 SS5]
MASKAATVVLLLLGALKPSQAAGFHEDISLNPTATTPTNFISCANTTDDIALAVKPSCGALDSKTFAEVNTGVNTSAIKTIIAFGDSWTSNGSNGTVPFAPVVYPPNPSAGARQGNNERARASNGYVWVEDLANTIGAKLVNYAVGGAVIDLKAYNSTNNGTVFTSDNLRRTSLVDEVAFFNVQGQWVADTTPETTLYTFSFGINDMTQFGVAGGDYSITTASYIKAIDDIVTVHKAKNILVQSVISPTTAFNAVQHAVFAALVDQHSQNGVNFAWADLGRLFASITASNSSMTEFGYKGMTCLLSQNTTVGGCDDPAHYVYWIPSHPSYQTHELINQYTLAAINECIV